jgi:hypothetical protein
MPSKRKSTIKLPDGNSGLTTETSSNEEKADENMNSDVSQAAAQELPAKDPYAEGNATLKALDELFESHEKKANSHKPQSLPEGREMEVEEERPPLQSSEEKALKDSEDKDEANEDPSEEEQDDEDEEECLFPPSCNYFPGSVEVFTEKMRFNGLTWWQEVKKRVKKDPNLKKLLQWVNSRPSPMDVRACVIMG